MSGKLGSGMSNGSLAFVISGPCYTCFFAPPTAFRRAVKRRLCTYGPEPDLGCHHYIELFDSLVPNALSRAEGLLRTVLG